MAETFIRPDGVSERHWDWFDAFLHRGATHQQLAATHGVAVGSVDQALDRVLRLYLQQERYRRVTRPTTMEKVKRVRTETVCEIMMTANVRHKSLLRQLFKHAPWVFGELAESPNAGYYAQAYMLHFDANACAELVGVLHEPREDAP